MEYPSLSLKQDSIDRLFSGIQDDFKVTPSPDSRSKKHYHKQKDLLLQNPVVDECDQCGFKTSKYKALYRHKREQHTVLRQKCTDCEYSNIYPNRVRKHYQHVHLGMKRKQRIRQRTSCQRRWCEYFGTIKCVELQEHSLFMCEECKLTFSRSDGLKFHKDKFHLGLIFKCKYCDAYSTARKSDLDRHILAKHEGWKENRSPRSCTEEGCTYVDLYGTLKRHIQSRHEGIILKCHIENCNFETSWSKNLKRHIFSKHQERDGKEIGNLKPKRPKPCTEEGCTYVALNGSLKEHIQTKHEGMIFKCHIENCNVETSWAKSLRKHIKTHNTAVMNCVVEECNAKMKDMDKLKRHIFSKHSNTEGKKIKKVKSRTPKPCEEEGCTYVARNGSLKEHIQTKHDAIMLKCHNEHCNFETSWAKNLKRHITTHDTEVEVTEVEECDVTLKGMKDLKRHITFVHEEQTKYKCQSDVCTFQTTSKKNHLIHTKKCKYLHSPSITKPSLVDNEVSGKDIGIEVEDEKSHKILCNVSGCDFITYGGDETKNEEHFRNNHKGEELTQDSFILLNSAMADAMEILREIREIKEATTSK